MFEDELAFLDEQEHEGGGDYDAGYHQLVNAPLITLAALEQYLDYFPSRGLLGVSYGERIYLNTNAPSSGVICGAQSSGKSHTLSCILENALIPSSRIGALPEPLAALVLYFDPQECGRRCEAASLASASNTASGTTSMPKITVLCSPSNLTRRTRVYHTLKNVQVVPLYFSEQDLTVDRVLSFMGCDNPESMPPYMNTLLRIMRSMEADMFTYSEFKHQLAYETLETTQATMLKRRMDLLESFLRPEPSNIQPYFASGEIVLVDLTDPFLDGKTAGLLFDIVLESFVAWEASSGKIVVLDEAHKFLTSSETARFNQSLANTIRLQRQLATSVIIATQEPTVIPHTILDLSSFITCHRFSSPSWRNHLDNHVNSTQSQDADTWFQKVMMLATGECVMFSPTALVGVYDEGEIELLTGQFLEVKIRPRLRRDGGRSLPAVSQTMKTLNMAEVTTSTPEDWPPENTQRVAPVEVPVPQNISSAVDLASSHTHTAFPAFIRDDSNVQQTSFPVAPRATASNNLGTNSSNTDVPDRFRVLVAFLRAQHASGVSRVTHDIAGQHIRQRLSATGTQLSLKEFAEDARRSGIVTTGGKGIRQYIALVSTLLAASKPTWSTAPVEAVILPQNSRNIGFPSPSFDVVSSSSAVSAAPQLSRSQTLPQLPARLKPFVDSLLANGATVHPIVLDNSYRKTFNWLLDKKSVYKDKTKLGRWMEMLQEANSQPGLIQLENTHLTEQQLKQFGRKKTARLLHPGPFNYV